MRVKRGRRSSHGGRGRFPTWAALALLALGGPAARAQPSASPSAPAGALQTAPVVVDGETLFRLRGVSAFPAEQRAAQVAQNIRAVASDEEIEPDSLRIEPSEVGLEIKAGDRLITTVVEADAELEGIGRSELAHVVLQRIQAAIREYREARSGRSLLVSGVSALIATVLLVLTLFVFFSLMRRLQAFLLRRLRRRIDQLEAKSHEILQARPMWRLLLGLLGLSRTVTSFILIYLYLQFTLGLFPWTRWIANRLGQWIVDPLYSMADSFLEQIPNLIFLVLLFLVVRYGLRLARLFFEAIDRQRLRFEGFEPEWAMPTYKLARLLIVAFALVVAYPYIPGSESAAFKGVSLFLGVVVSLGSSSAISNAIAGFLMTYRRAFRVGDRIQIGDIRGDVTEVRLQVTHVRTSKNEEVVIPNSTILTSPVTNYTTLAKSRGLILHTTVGIGYETPWRQVEAMLRTAAERTPGLRKEPPPFVLQRALGDFAITYELNAYCDDPSRMWPLYTELHRNILDVFNEYGVAIMTPAYEADPAEAKVVPRERWFEAPAVEPDPRDAD